MNSRADLLYEAVGALSVCHTPGLGEVELSGVSKTAVVRSVIADLAAFATRPVERESDQ